jgi:ATP-dependent Lhr-like helicase
MQKKIWNMKWDQLTPIQNKSIPLVINTSKDIIISSGTASGKTEAAFLPVLTLVENSAKERLKVLYISPLKALINNQFVRIEKLCDFIEVPIYKWHGDVSQSSKNKFIKNPTGILQITPESIESLFINRTNHLNSIFKELEFIIIDEIHSFIDVERGVQLRSLIHRLEEFSNLKPRIIGLSATIDNFNLVKEWVNFSEPQNVEILEISGNNKELHYNLMHFEKGEDDKVPLELFEDIRDITREMQSIIFCNSRGDVEESTVYLNRLAEKDKLGEVYYAHHSSIDKKEREYVEKTMSSSSVPKSVVATSSLELGIDIGEIDLVIQIDSTFTVSSLKQRLGRSGRSKDANQYLQLYTTKDDSLIQSLAVMELILEGWVEPAKGYPIPFDILFHQIISICNEKNGLRYNLLFDQIKKNPMFYNLEQKDINELVEHMTVKNFLEKIKGTNELIVGLEGERLLRSKDFYSVFATSEEYEVLEGIKKIGQLDKGFIINVDDNIILAGKLWTITDINYERDKVYVTKAKHAKKPSYCGGGAKLHKKIPEKMMEILCNTNEFNYINETASNVLKDIRYKYNFYNIQPNNRVIWELKDGVIFEPFTGTTISKTLMWMLRKVGVNVSLKDTFSRMKTNSGQDIIGAINKIKNMIWSEEDLLEVTRSEEFFQSKFSEYLPEELKIKMHIANEIDIPETINYLNSYDFIEIKHTNESDFRN